jgi:hypothetical protein
MRYLPTVCAPHKAFRDRDAGKCLGGIICASLHYRIIVSLIRMLKRARYNYEAEAPEAAIS